MSVDARDEGTPSADARDADMLAFARFVRRLEGLWLVSAALLVALPLAAMVRSSIPLALLSLAAAIALVIAHVARLHAVCPRCGDRFFVVGSPKAPHWNARYGSETCVNCRARRPRLGWLGSRARPDRVASPR